MKNLILSLAAVSLLPAAAAAQTDLGPLNLPAMSTTLPLSEDFDVAAGVVPGYMALTALDVATLLPDAEAWANIGQNAACTNPFSGAFNLEMGLIPGSTNYHDVRNAMVISIDPTGYTGDMTMSHALIDGGEEVAAEDNVWISNDGTMWYAVSQDWFTLSTTTNTWENIDPVLLTGTAVDTSIPFYLAFVQQDNFPYLDLDGVGIDDIMIPGIAPPPVLSSGGLEGGAYATLSIESLYPNASATFLASLQGAGPGMYNGIAVDLTAPILTLAQRATDINGFAIFSQVVPAGLAGSTVYLQAIVANATDSYVSTGLAEVVN